jgi:hypothetical protein
MMNAKLANLIRTNKEELIVTAFWITIVSAVVIVSYYWIYVTTPWGYWGTAFSESPWEGPSIGIIGLIVLAISSFTAGCIINDSRSLILAYSSTTIISFLIAVAFSFSYVWLVLNYQVTGVIPYAWEYVLYMAVVNVFRMFFPTALFTCLFGVAFGAIMRVYILGK